MKGRHTDVEADMFPFAPGFSLESELKLWGEMASNEIKLAGF